jgi:hypothetical protein
MPKSKSSPLDALGWREWVALPALGIPEIKAKVDTGARTSTLHAFSLQPFQIDGQEMIRFDMHPLQRNTHKMITCEAQVVDIRSVTDSGGHREDRYVIRTPIAIGELTWSIEVTLTERDTMLFRMLLARNAIRGKFLVNPGRSFLMSKRIKKVRT